MIACSYGRRIPVTVHIGSPGLRRGGQQRPGKNRGICSFQVSLAVTVLAIFWSRYKSRAGHCSSIQLPRAGNSEAGAGSVA